MPLFTIIAHYKKGGYFMQIQSANFIQGLEQWADMASKSKVFGKTKRKTLLRSMEKGHYINPAKNVLDVRFLLGKDFIHLFVIKTSDDPQADYVLDQSIDYIYNNMLDKGEKTKKKDIEMILALAFEYLEHKGIVQYEGDIPYIDGRKTMHIDDEEQEGYIYKRSQEEGKYYDTPFIEDILDLDFEYMETIGLLGMPKIYILGMEFDEPSEN